MPTTTFFGLEIANICKTWLAEPWVTQNEKIHYAFIKFLAKAYKIVSRDQGPDKLYIHLYNTFDSDGKQYPFRRIDFVHALHKWMMHVTTTDVDLTNQYYNVVRSALEDLEPLLDETRKVTPVECLLRDSPVYMNGHS